MLPTITCDEYRQMRDMGTDHLLIDVREQDEWDAGHIEGAVHLPLGQISEKITEVAPEKNATIIMNCARGGRSAKACQKLIDLGYKNVKNLEGGYEAYCASI
jgi:rhodanese-related sulfurtransferase